MRTPDIDRDFAMLYALSRYTNDELTEKWGVSEEIVKRIRDRQTEPLSNALKSMPKVKAVKRSGPVGSRSAPPHWQPKEKHRIYADDNHVVNFEEQVERFKYYEFKRSYTDWDKCFFNWLRNAEKKLDRGLSF
jgi:hypothetical protein